MLRDLRLGVPPFQRPFSWTTEQVEAFWTDLDTARQLGQPEYFLGTIVITPGESRGTWTVIDGQQRLGVTVMLLAAIRNAFLGAKDSERAAVIETDYIASRTLRSASKEPRLRLNQEDDDFFQGLILSQAWDVPPEAVRLSHRRIQAAFSTLSNQLSASISQSTDRTALLLSWADFLDSQVQVIVVSVPNDSDAFLIFETLNDRGLDLTIADLLRNYLFSLAEDRLAVLASDWDSAVVSLELRESGETLTTFIRHYWSSLHGATREKELYRSIRARIRLPDEAVRLVADLRNVAPLYAALLDPGNEFWTRASTVARSGSQVIQRLGLEQNRPLLLVGMELAPPDDLAEILASVISWSVRGLVVGGIGGGTTERYYADAAVALRNAVRPNSSAAYDALKPIIADDSEFESRFSDFRVTRLALAQYYLSAIESQLRDQEVPAVPSQLDLEGSVISRVLPMRADETEWPAFEGEAIAGWSQRLGNLVLLEPHLDRELPRGEWSASRAVLARSQFASTRMVADKDAWSPASIRERQAYLASQASRVWPRVPSSATR